MYWVNIRRGPVTTHNGTWRSQHGQYPTSTDKILTTRGLFEVGIWPGRTTGLNLRKKYGRYRGNTDLYHRDVAEKRSYYNMAAFRRAADASGKSVMVEKSYGKY